MFKDIEKFPKSKLSELAQTPMDELQIRFPGYRRDDLRAKRREFTPTVNPIRTSAEEIGDLPERIKQALLKGHKDWKLTDLCDAVDSSPSRVNDAIEMLKRSGVNIQLVADAFTIPKELSVTRGEQVIPVEFTKGTWFRFGAVGDNHLCSKYERLDVLNRLYDVFAEEGITTVLNTGNAIDGEARFNKFEIHKHGIDDQCDYFAEAYPQREGITTKFITGDDHEGWYVQREGVDIGKYMQQRARDKGRDDLQYIGHMEVDIVFETPLGKAVVRVAHPGGGSSYAVSYTSQKIVESYSGNEKPDILLNGHYHKADYTYVRGVHVVQTGCTTDQSPFMRKKRLAAHLGGWIIEFQQGPTGAIQRFRCEFIPFFDRPYYDKKWEFKR